MSKVEAAYTVAPGLTFLSWLFSLRRTVERDVWMVGALGWATIGGVVGLAIATGSHTTMGGVLGWAVPWGLMALIPAIVVEVGATVQNSAIARYRTKPGKPGKPAKTGTWKLAVSARETTHDGQIGPISVGIRNGPLYRELGMADPLDDENGFMELKARAERACETYNAHKIGGS